MNTSLESVGATLVIGAYTVLGVWLLYHFLLNYGTYRKFHIAAILGSSGGDMSRSTAGMLFIGLSFAVGMIAEDFSDTLFRQKVSDKLHWIGYERVYVDETALRANVLFPHLLQEFQIRAPRTAQPYNRSAITVDLARNGAFCKTLDVQYLGQWNTCFDAVLLDDARFKAAMAELDAHPERMPPAYASKSFRSARPETSAGHLDTGELSPSRQFLYNISQQLYYQAKNCIYLLDKPYTELERLHLRLDFVRSLLFVSYWLLVLVIGIGGAYLLASLLHLAWVWRRAAGNATETEARHIELALLARVYLVRLVFTIVVLLALTTMSKAVYIHENQQYHLRVFGIYGTIRSEFGQEILKTL